MSDDPATASRRGFLKMIGGTVVLLPLAGINSCSKEADPPPPTGRQTPPSNPPGTPGEMPRLAEDDPTALALGYRHDAGEVDTAKYPGRAGADQFCHNCILFQARGDEAWAGCTIFPGRAVSANGWCSAWAAKA